MVPMRIYIAAPYPLRHEAIQVMQRLEADGHTVTSRWLKRESQMSHEEATNDLADVAAADVLLALHPPDWHERGKGGRHVELGYAVALGKTVVLWGQRTNQFHHLRQVRTISSLDELSQGWACVPASGPDSSLDIKRGG